MNLIKITGALGAVAFVAGLTMAMSDGKKDTAPSLVRSTAGVVTGTIVFDGKVPVAKPLQMTDEQSKGCCADGDEVSPRDMSLVIDQKGRGIANVVVTFSVEGVDVAVPKDPVDVGQTGCRFDNHVVVVPAGTTVSYSNADAISHNIHTYAIKNEGINKTVAAGRSSEQKLEKAEVVKVTCDIHPWMVSYVVVTEATHWGITDEFGAFAIENAPAGTYSVALWHETLGKGKGKVTVNEDGSSELLEVKMAKKKKKKRRGR
jgi:plastocyanin